MNPTDWNGNELTNRKPIKNAFLDFADTVAQLLAMILNFVALIVP